MDVPKTEHSCGHLLEKDLLEDISQRKVRPINPHAQRLLAAQAREANPAKAKAKSKTTPAAKAKSATKKKQEFKGDSGDDHHTGAEPPKKKAKKSSDGGNEPPPTRTEYLQTFPGQETPRNPCNIYCMLSMPLHGKRKTVCFGLKRFVTLLRTDTTLLHVYIYTIYVGCYMLYM